MTAYIVWNTTCKLTHSLKSFTFGLLGNFRREVEVVGCFSGKRNYILVSGTFIITRFNFCTGFGDVNSNLSSSWHVPGPQRPHINVGSVKGLNIHINGIPRESFNLLDFYLQSCNPPELIINHWHILHKTIVDDILNSYDFPFKCA